MLGCAEPGDRLGFDPEPGEVVWPRPIPADHLERHQAVQAALAGAVDHAHAPFANHVQDLVGGNRGRRVGWFVVRILRGRAWHETFGPIRIRPWHINGQGVWVAGVFGPVVVAGRLPRKAKLSVRPS